jgi:predicted peptidase
MRRYSVAALVLVGAMFGYCAGAAATTDDQKKPDAPAARVKEPKPSAIDERGFEAHEHRDAKGATLPYRLLKPDVSKDKDWPGKPELGHPLLVFLHGIGERGTDNRRQLTWGRPMLRSAAKDYGAFVLVPQCPPTDTWTDRRGWKKTHAMSEKPTEPMRLLVELIDQLKKDHPIDSHRVYVMGLSMGGFGTWEMISRWPERFAAAVPICGGGDENEAKRIAAMPVWAFHGAADWIVPTERSRSMIEAIRKAGGKPKYTEYPGVGHASWVRAFADPGLLEWLFAQRRGVPGP